MQKQNSLIYDMLKSPAQVQEDELAKVRERAIRQQELITSQSSGDPIIDALNRGFAQANTRASTLYPRQMDQYAKAAGGLLGLKNKELGERVSMAGLTPEAREATQTQQTLKGMPRRSSQDLFNIADKLDSVGQAQKAEQIRDRARALEASELDKQAKVSTIIKNTTDNVKDTKALTFGQKYGIDNNILNNFSAESLDTAIKLDSRGPLEGQDQESFKRQVINTLKPKLDKPASARAEKVRPINELVGSSATDFSKQFSRKSRIKAAKLQAEGFPDSVVIDALIPSISPAVQDRYDEQYTIASQFKTQGKTALDTAYKNVDKAITGAGSDFKQSAARVLSFGLGMELEGLNASEIVNAIATNNVFVKGLEQRGILTDRDFERLEIALATTTANSKTVIKQFLSKLYSEGLTAEYYIEEMNKERDRLESGEVSDLRSASLSAQERAASRARVSTAKKFGVGYGLSPSEQLEVDKYNERKALLRNAVDLGDPSKLANDPALLETYNEYMQTRGMSNVR